MSGVDDATTKPDHKHKAPYTSHHPVPTVQRYREEKQEREEQYGGPQEEQDDRSKLSRLGDAYTALRHGPQAVNPDADTQPYKAENKNFGSDETEADDHAGRVESKKGAEDELEDTTEDTLSVADPKKARKAMKKFEADGTGREVTDPVTHLPITIHDFTEKELKETPRNGPPAGSEPKSATGAANRNKSDEQLAAEEEDANDGHEAMETLFPPPDFSMAREGITNAYKKAITAGLGMVSSSLVTVVALFHFARHTTGWTRAFSILVEIAVSVAVSAAVVMGVRQWTENKIKTAWETEVWEAERQKGRKLAKNPTAESAQWLNSLLASVWPLVNPDLFTSICDTLEDVMQASLPKMVRMVSVADVGQGSESLRILGVRWLPTGAAARSVGEHGELKKDEPGESDRTLPGEGEVQNDQKDQDGDGQDDGVAQGMEAEEGRRGMKERAKNAHLYLAFYMPANVKVPVWVELKGFIGVMRLRLQLTPDPPFFSLCTITFLGQPKVDLACIPLIKQGPNLMDLPLISHFVQSSVDAAMAEYVAPKSLTLDLKDMMMGDDFKKDTNAKGVIVVVIRHAFDFKEGDASWGPLKKGSADPYVAVGWAKFGKPLWSTRVLQNNMEPHWEETGFLLVSTEELNVDERLRLQLFDSDRTSADDDLGRIELDLKGLMKDSATNGKMCDRKDGFRSLKKGDGMPGKLSWSLGYFSKTRITNEQLAAQEDDPDIRTIDQLREKVHKQSENKLREAGSDEKDEVEQQKAQDFKAREDELIITSPPPSKYPSGILSIQIHQITGLELETLNKSKASEKETGSDEEEEGDDLPSAYCTIILNHQKVFKTRTKPKNAKPFFNAGCERFIRDVKNTEVHISVRDARLHEKDALLGMIYLPLERIFKDRSQINANFPIAGGVGYGRARISMVFRSVQLQAPQRMLGWEYGTLEIVPFVKAISIASDLQNLRMKIRTTLARGKLHSGSQDDELNSHDGHIVWKTKRQGPIRLPVRKRYSTPLVVEFRKDATISDHTPAFAILWLKDIPDNEEQTVRLTVWKGDLSRAQDNVLDEYGEKVGEIELKLTLWSGLSGYHNRLAKKDPNLADVMEVLDTCNDNEEMNWDNGEDSNTSDSSDSSTSDSGSDDESGVKKLVPGVLKKGTNSSMDSDGKRGPLDSLKEYKQNSKTLHRKHRGVMQWKGPRTLAWMKHVASKGENKVEGLLHHKERTVGIETEA